MRLREVLLESFQSVSSSADVKALMKRNRMAIAAVIGIYLGYPLDGIRAFIQRVAIINAMDRPFSERDLPRNTPTSFGTPFDGTGYIPSGRDLKMGYEKVVAMINRNRFATSPFEDNADVNFDHIMNLLSTDKNFERAVVMRLNVMLKAGVI